MSKIRDVISQIEDLYGDILVDYDSDLEVQVFYIICEDNAHTVPVGQSTTYLITIKDNQFCFCIHNFSISIIKPIFFSEWNSTLSTKYFDSGGGQITNVTLTVEVPTTTQGVPSAGMTAP